MGDRMRKWLLLICVVLFLGSLLFNDSDVEEIRIRVVANSNSEEDILLKEEIVAFLYENYEFNFDSYSECDEYIKNHLNMISNDLVEIDDKIKVSYQMHNFYNKAYNDIALENGEYLTLLIEIDNATGDNYWGALYGNNVKEDTNTIIYKSFFLELFE